MTKLRIALAAATFTGLLVASSARAAGPKEDVWRAWATTSGKEARLVVEGIVANGGPGKVALVAPAVPQGVNRKILLLELKFATLPGIWPAVVTPIPAHYVQAPYKKETYDSVQVRYPDGTVISIKKIVDAGGGPKTAEAASVPARSDGDAPAVARNERGFKLCADFSLYADNTVFPNVFTLSGYRFENHGTRP